MFYTRPQYHNT